MGGVELASVVRQLRAELNEALVGAEGERLRFELGPVENSLRVTVGHAVQVEAVQIDEDAPVPGIEVTVQLVEHRVRSATNSI